MNHLIWAAWAALIAGSWTDLLPHDRINPC